MPTRAGPHVTTFQQALADRYRIERELGVGGMARVYLARDLKHDRLVAVKVMLPEVAASFGAERFLREIQLAARLTHPHILPLLDSGTADGVPFYVMPFVDGEDIRARLDREGRLEVADAVQIAREVADALNYAHAADVLHRDVKPENILMLAGHAVMLDFGVARAMSASMEEDAGADGEAAGIAVGTPAYMSPEQAAGEAGIDGRSDQYGLGLMLWEMLSGEQPFTGPTVQAVIAKRFFEVPAPIDSVRSDVPPHVVEALTKALSSDPAARFSTAGAFAKELARATATAPAVAPPKLPSIAVLPFTNIGHDPENAFLADGIADEVISALGRLRTLQVAARTSSYAFRGKTDDLASIGTALKVAHVLEGSVQRGGARLRVKVALLRVADGQQLWQAQFDRLLDDVFAIQDEISASISAALETTLVSGSATAPAPGAYAPLARAAAPSTDVETYQLYLKGRFQWNRRTEEGLSEAVALFRAATERDPHFAPAFAGLADSYVVLGTYGARAPHEVMPLARDMARKALAIDPSLAEPHAALGMVAASYDHDWAAAEASFARAVTLAPAYATAYQWRAVALWVPLARFDDAMADIAQAQALDPLSLAISATAGIVLALAGRCDDAIARHSQTLALAPTFGMAHFFLAQAQLGAGQVAEAEESVAQAIDLTGGSPEMFTLGALVAAAMGDRSRAEEVRDGLLGLRDERYVGASLMARAHLASGAPEEAIAWLQRAVDERDADVIYLGARHEYAPLLGQAAFTDLLDQLRL
jgi:serine/threonine protein kinase/tetratricopeptide (TPR) repeat protein